MNRENLESRRQLCTKIQQVRTTLESLEDHLLEIDREMQRLEAGTEISPEIVSKRAPSKAPSELDNGIVLPIAAG